MGFFVSVPDLADGEEVLLDPAAKRQIDGRGIGGRLFVTDRRLVFQPSNLYRFTRATTWEVPHAQVAEVGDVDRNLDDALMGGLRRRLEIRTVDGRRELFDVNHLARVELQVRKAVQAGGGASG